MLSTGVLPAKMCVMSKFCYADCGEYLHKHRNGNRLIETFQRCFF
ncbi:hypothetical protein BrE312_2610 [Brenneria sp. EniD312]|nr:hypothetical protein BrE312_2610 [Brenneria sp. EniD312]